MHRVSPAHQQSDYVVQRLVGAAHPLDLVDGVQHRGVVTVAELAAFPAAMPRQTAHRVLGPKLRLRVATETLSVVGLRTVRTVFFTTFLVLCYREFFEFHVRGRLRVRSEGNKHSGSRAQICSRISDVNSEGLIVLPHKRQRCSMVVGVDKEIGYVGRVGAARSRVRSDGPVHTLSANNRVAGYGQ